MSDRFDNMVNYASQQTECRSRVIQQYFGDENAQPCGVCDVCLQNKRRRNMDRKSLCDTILHLLNDSSLTARELCREIKNDPQLIAKAIEDLQQSGKISTSIGGKLIINE